MSLFVLDLAQLYRVTFGGEPYEINNSQNLGFQNSKDQSLVLTKSGRSTFAQQYNGKEIWLPTKFINLNQKNLAFPNGAIPFSFNELLLPYTTVQISGNKSYIETDLIGRTGSVKEFYNQGDFDITIRGFLIDEQQRLWPEDQLYQFNTLFSIGQAIDIENAKLNPFLESIGGSVIIKKFDLPEVVGGKTHIVPFSLECVSDSIFDLIVK